jgi:LDH2 family malate/lactate/ureidoglycolate dehydrogenase
VILAIRDARSLMEACLTTAGHTQAEAEIISDHLIDCELRGLPEGGFSRCLSIIERLRSAAEPRQAIRVVRETPTSATLHGGDQVGYLVATQATEMAIAKTKQCGMAVIGAHETWYTGMFSYYLEKIVAQGFVGMVAGSGTQIVAPHGGTEGRFCTNPIAFGFPSNDTPVIWDIGTSTIIHADAVLAKRNGRDLDPGQAFDRNGNPTLNPDAALQGALTVWGGHRGSGLAMVIQLLGALSGASVAPVGIRDCGFFLWVIDPAILTLADEFKQQVSDYAKSVRATRPEIPGHPVRVPFDRSIVERNQRLAAGKIEAPDDVIEALRKTCHAAG